MTAYACALCRTAYDSLRGAIECCEDTFDGDDDPDRWHCADCGQAATRPFRRGAVCLWCANGVAPDTFATAADLRTDGGATGEGGVD